jgi:hypothetical protein
MWFADRSMRSMTGRGNTCILVLTLDSVITPHSLHALIECDAFSYLSSLRLTKRFLKPLAWVADQENRQHTVPEVQVPDTASIDERVAAWNILPTSDHPVQIRLMQIGDSHSALVFLWHHSLFDAHGAERFFQALLSDEKRLTLTVKFPVTTSAKSVTLKELDPLRKHILQCTRSPIWYPSHPRRKERSSIRYQRVDFSEKETKQIDMFCNTLGAELFRSCAYIGITARAVRDSSESSAGDFYIPVPHDTRKSVKGGVVGGNQLSFFFFGVKRSELDDLPKAVDTILLMTQQMIERSLHKLCRPFFQKLQKLPHTIYRLILESPTKGQNASFYLSDTGDSLSAFTHVGTATVTDATHFPPNFCPPGLTFVFTRYKNKLRIIIVSDDLTVSEQHATRLQENLQKLLIGETAR